MNRKSLDYVNLFAVLFAVFLGAAVRFYPVLLSNFPLNDGGLFYQMTQDVLDHNFSLPFYTSYNGNEIPFGYPPFAFYFMALIQRLFHFGIIDQLHFLPAFFSTLCIPAFYFLSKSVTGSKEKSAFAVFAYALMPRSYLWLIMGGGITRSLGILFGILSVISVWEMFRKPKIPALLLSILFCTLTILSHPETAWFVFLTSLLIGIRYGLNKKGIQFAIMTILGILLLTSPWWIAIMQRHGISLLLNTAQTGEFFSVSIALFYFTGEPFITILAVIALFGLFAELVRRRFFLFVWILLILILSARSGETFVTIPGSILFGSGVVLVLVPGLLSYAKQMPDGVQTLAQIMNEGISKLALGFILILALFAAMAIPNLGFLENYAFSQYDHEAMEWISQNTYSNDQFAILTGEQYWAEDQISEWFPVLSKRISVSTVQGSEWLPDHEFQKHIERYNLLQSCARKDFSCILTWSQNNNINFSNLYIIRPKVGEEDSQLPIAYSLTTSNHFKLIFENPGVSVFKVVDIP